MNLSLKRGTVCLCGAIKPEDTHKNVFSVISQLLHFCNKILRGRDFVVVVTYYLISGRHMTEIRFLRIFFLKRATLLVFWLTRSKDP